MKKILSKLKIRRVKEVPVQTRITSETVAEHRERILAGGRRFKYPLQYAKHKLVINAIIISLVALVTVTIVGYFQLYKYQNTSEFIYRITKVLPLPVAVVDNQNVAYSDYLMKYRSSIHYLEQKEQVNFKTDDGKRQIEYIKQRSMSSAIADAYAQKLAKQLKITVSRDEVESFIKKQRQSSEGEVSIRTYETTILDYLDWNPDEYRHITKNNIIRQKVMFALDDGALDVINDINKTLTTTPTTSLSELSASLLKDNKKTTYGNSGWLPRTNQDGGLTEAAVKLNANQLSSIIKSTNGDGYYILRLLAINDTQVKYEYIHVPLTVFEKQLDDIIKNDKKTIKYIKL